MEFRDLGEQKAGIQELLRAGQLETQIPRRDETNVAEQQRAGRRTWFQDRSIVVGRGASAFVELWASGEAADSACWPSALQVDSSQAEQQAILGVLSRTSQHSTCEPHWARTVHTETLSSFLPTAAPGPRGSAGERIFQVIKKIASTGAQPPLCFVKAHTGIEGHEAADKLAGQVSAKDELYSHARPIRPDLAPLHFKAMGRATGKENLRPVGESLPTAHLYAVSRGESLSTAHLYAVSRLGEMVFCRMRLGALQFLVGREDFLDGMPTCPNCRADLNTHHSLFDCPVFRQQRRVLYRTFLRAVCGKG